MSQIQFTGSERLIPGLVAVAAGVVLMAPLPAQADIVNEGRATATAPGGPEGAVSDADAVTIDTQAPATGLAASMVLRDGQPTTASGANAEITDAGDRLIYEVTVSNTGNVTLDNVVVDAPGPQLAGRALASSWTPPLLVSASDAGGDGRLGPGETWRYRADYVLAQADIDAATSVPDGIVNAVSVSATDPAGNAVAPSGDGAALTAFATIPSVPAIELEKLAKNGGAVQTTGWAVGDTVTYEFTVTNTGNVTLSDVSVVDGPEAFTGQGELSPVTPASVERMAPGESAVFTATYVIVQADIDTQ